MGIGASIFLIAVGAILAFAVNVDLGGLDINVVGWILMIAGVLGLVMTTLIWGRRRTVVPPAPVEEPPVVTQAPVEERRVVTEEPVEYRRVEERRRDVGPPI